MWKRLALNLGVGLVLLYSALTLLFASIVLAKTAYPFLLGTALLWGTLLLAGVFAVAIGGWRIGQGDGEA